MSAIRTVGIVGAGTMGSRIAVEGRKGPGGSEQDQITNLMLTAGRRETALMLPFVLGGANSQTWCYSTATRWKTFATPTLTAVVANRRYFG